LKIPQKPRGISKNFVPGNTIRHREGRGKLIMREGGEKNMWPGGGGRKGRKEEVLLSPGGLSRKAA